MTELLELRRDEPCPLDGDLAAALSRAQDYGPVLIMLHGSGPGVSSWSNFRGNLHRYSRRSTAPSCWTCRGLAAAAEGSLDRRYPHVAADAVATLMDRLDIPTAHFLGAFHGRGVVSDAVRAVAFRARGPAGAHVGPGGINVIGPLRSARSWQRLDEFLAAPTREAMVAWVHTMVADRSIVTDALIDERLKNALEPGVVESARAIFASLNDPRFRDDPPVWALTHRIRHRTLITWGRDDRMSCQFENGLLPWRRDTNARNCTYSRSAGTGLRWSARTAPSALCSEFLSRP